MAIYVTTDPLVVVTVLIVVDIGVGDGEGVIEAVAVGPGVPGVGVPGVGVPFAQGSP